MEVLVKNQQRTVRIDRKRIAAVCRTLLSWIAPEECELSILIVSDSGIRKINKKYLGRDCATNVISFAMSEGDFGDINPHLLGDIVISSETAKRQSEETGISLDDSIDYLIIHGILHLMGYDHERPGSDAALMEKKEKEFFFRLRGYYID
ncbi:MAG: rRNA maturation RNase YbeY [Deltaproteobacteria bacterium]|nr:rRNA maturation RNase YbeY [Deltaproteobacteria bacterium]